MPGYLSESRLEPAALLAEIAAPSCGATVLFVGTVRSSPEDGDVTGIEYSAYREMAVAELDRIVAAVGARWPTARVAIRHRLGFIPAGEASIAIAVASPHRAVAYDVSRFVIEEIKRHVTIWKKERFVSGSARWVERRSAEQAHA
jgi:molybdopterin synthase catalytic subunit